MSEERSKALSELAELDTTIFEIEREYEERVDAWWGGLTEEERMMAFYSVVKRIVQGELREHQTYRGILYDTFGFDPGSYMMGMSCGFMELHNSIYTREEMRALRDRELAAAGTKVITSKVVTKDD